LRANIDLNQSPLRQASCSRQTTAAESGVSSQICQTCYEQYHHQNQKSGKRKNNKKTGSEAQRWN